MTAAESRPWFPAKAAIGPDLPKSSVPVGDQPQANIVVRAGGLRRAEDRPDEVVVKVRCPQGELRLFQSKQAVMVPRGLPEHSKRKRVASKDPGVRLARRTDIGEKIRTEQPRSGLHGLNARTRRSTSPP